jgi:hypothetical protein
MTGCKHAAMLAFSHRKELASRIMVVFSVGKKYQWTPVYLVSRNTG